MRENFEGLAAVSNVRKDDNERFISIGPKRRSRRERTLSDTIGSDRKDSGFCLTAFPLREPDSASRENALTRRRKRPIFPPRPEGKRELRRRERPLKTLHSRREEYRRFKPGATVEKQSKTIYTDPGSLEAGSETTHSDSGVRRFSKDGVVEMFGKNPTTTVLQMRARATQRADETA